MDIISENYITFDIYFKTGFFNRTQYRMTVINDSVMLVPKDDNQLLFEIPLTDIESIKVIKENYKLEIQTNYCMLTGELPYVTDLEMISDFFSRLKTEA